MPSKEDSTAIQPLQILIPTVKSSKDGNQHFKGAFHGIQKMQLMNSTA